MAINRRTKGFFLVEMLIYVALLAAIFVVLVKVVLSFSDSYKTVSAARAADVAGMNVLERMTREIRAAATAATSSPSTLTLTNTSTTTQFYLLNNVVYLKVNGSYLGPLTGSSSSVTSLTFNLLSTTTSSAVKVDMTVQGQSGTVTRTKSFHSTVILKGT